MSTKKELTRIDFWNRPLDHDADTCIQGFWCTWSSHCRTSECHYEGLLYVRTLLPFIALFFKAVNSCSVLQRCCASYASLRCSRVRYFYFYLERCIGRGCSIPMRPPTPMGNDDTTLFQYCKFTYVLVLKDRVDHCSVFFGLFTAALTCFRKSSSSYSL